MSSQSIPAAGRLIGKVAVITGGATGFGRATALAFSEHGANVSIFDIQEQEGRKTVQMIRDAGGEAIFVKADVTKLDEIDHAFDESIKAFGLYLAYLVNAHDGLVRRIWLEAGRAVS